MISEGEESFRDYVFVGGRNSGKTLALKQWRDSIEGEWKRLDNGAWILIIDKEEDA